MQTQQGRKADDRAHPVSRNQPDCRILGNSLLLQDGCDALRGGTESAPREPAALELDRVNRGISVPHAADLVAESRHGSAGSVALEDGLALLFRSRDELARIIALAATDHSIDLGIDDFAE